MTLATIVGIVLSLSATPNGVSKPSAVFFQEESKPPAQETAPSQPTKENPSTQTTNEQAAPAPPEASAPVTQTPPPSTTENPPAKQTSTETAKPKTSAVKKRKARSRKPTAKPAANPSEPKKVVVSHGGTAEPVIQISSGKPSTTQDVSSTNSLLDATSSNLKKIAGRQLGPAQQDMVNQIRAYVEQAKTASEMGDTQGAHNLAFKAHLLSEELLKQ